MIRYILFFSLMISTGLWLQAQITPRFQLSPPQMEIDSVFFFQYAEVKLELDYPGASIHYTTDGTSMDTNSMIYDGPFYILGSVDLRAKAFHPNLLNSEEVGVSLRQLPAQMVSMDLQASEAPDSRYRGSGMKGLMDQKKGSLNFAGDKTQWMGWQTDSLNLTINFAQATALNSLTLSTLENHGAWIFTPQSVQIFEEDRLIGEYTYPVPEAAKPAGFQFLDIPLEPGDYNTLTVRLQATPLPAWHPGTDQDQVGWIFIDEIIPLLKD